MKPDLYWQSLSPDEKKQLAEEAGIHYSNLCNIFNGKRFLSLEQAIEISGLCENLVDPLDFVTESNRKAIKAYKSAK